MKIELNRVWTVAEIKAALAGQSDDVVVVFEKTRKSEMTGKCWCGCGGVTKNKFVPGHDSKFHSLAKQVARGQAEMPESFVNEDAEADFMKWHDAEVPKWAAKQAAKKAKAAAKEAAKKVKEEVLKDAEVQDFDEIDQDSEEFKQLFAEMT